MDVRPLAVLLLALPAPLRAGTVRVELVPELGSTRGSPSGSASLVPLQLSAGALVPVSLSPALPAPSSLVPSPVPAAVVPAALAATPLSPLPAKAAASKGDRPLVIKTLAETPALDVSKLGAGEAAAATEADFMARAQLGGPAASGGGGGAFAASAELAPRRRLFGLLPAAKTPAKTAAPAPPGGYDETGARMKDALVRAAAAKGESVLLGFVPTPKSLQVMAEERTEFMLYRRRADGAWLLHGGGETTAVRNSDDDWDVGLHNHPMIPGLSAYTARYPTPEDLRAARGLDARVGVVTPQGVVEWNPSLPKNFWERLTRGWFGRAATGVFMPYLYEGHVKRLGLGVADLSWKKVTQEWIERRTPAPLSAELLIDEVIPALIAEELPVVAAKLGYELTPERKADALKRSNGYRMYWHSSWSYKDHPDHTGIPDGHFRKDFGIRLMVKPDWRKLKDIPANFRPLYAHEYTHWLQNEGHVSYKYGGEIAAVAVEILRAIELIGFEAVRDGRAGTVHAGNWSSFEGGREWARAGFKTETTPYSKGALAGAAWEAAAAAGRPEAAWEFLGLVIAGKNALEPAAAWAKVVGSR